MMMTGATMATRNRALVWTVLILLLVADPCLGRGNRDVMQDDVDTPKQPGCENSFVLVRVSDLSLELSRAS